MAGTGAGVAATIAAGAVVVGFAFAGAFAGACLTGCSCIALSFSTEPGLTVIADAERLYQVISNLVSNALKFTVEDGMVDIFARPVTDSEGALVEFVVSDTGRGMIAEEMGHIFERFWRVREANPTGLGLGLYIARGIVQAHGGTLRVESVVGVGSTFYFTIPAS